MQRKEVCRIKYDDNRQSEGGIECRDNRQSEGGIECRDNRQSEGGIECRDNGQSEMENDKWHWQETGTAWKGIGIYHVTLVVPSRKALLGRLVIPDKDPAKAYVERTQMGESIVNEIYHLCKIHPEIRILQFCLMPDHLHFIIHVTRAMKMSIRRVMQGFWQGTKRIGRMHTLSVVSALNAESINKVDEAVLNTGSIDKVDVHQAFPIFTEQPFIRPLSRKGQLQTMYRYIRMNPQRLATRKLKPGYFCTQRGVEIGGRMYDIVGNAAILTSERYLPVHVRRTMVEAAEHGDGKALKDYMNACVLAARDGAVMVSPFISQEEKQIQAKLLEEGLSFICIADNGLGEYYKPVDGLFDAVAAGRVMILSPWEYNPKKGHITRDECVAMNKMAEEICEGLSGMSY